MQKTNSTKSCQNPGVKREYIPNLVSVIVPTYNRAHFILKAVDSVLAQTYRPIELIIVDDGSTDETDGVVEEWSSKLFQNDNFRVYYLTQQNKGPSAARNLGIVRCQGEYIQFLDSDDTLHQDKIK